MISNEPIGIIEFGSVKIKCIIFKINNNIPEILSTSLINSEGIHNGVVINLSKATAIVRSCISTAEKKQKEVTNKVNKNWKKI